MPARRSPEVEGFPAGGRFVRTLLASVQEGVVVYDRDLRYRVWNPYMETLTGLRAADVLGREALGLFPHLRRNGIDALLRRALEGETVRSPDTPFHVPATGRSGWMVGHYGPILSPGGKVLGVVGVVHDITERRRVEEENLRLAAFPREIPNPVVECGADGRVTYHNPAAARAAAELDAGDVGSLLPPTHAHLVRAALESGRAIRGVEVPSAGRILSWTYHPHPPLGLVHLFAEDVTAQRGIEEQLRHEALHDPLTGLPNRHLFLEHLARAILRARERDDYLFAVLFLDLDRFKLVNDGLGHHVGDELLGVVARRIRAALRAEDTVARFGGDEFAVLLTDIGDPALADQAAERIQRAIAAPVNLDGYEVFTSASIGIALSSSAYGRPEYLLRNADMAMYRAKAAGTGRHEVFDRAMHARALLRLQKETELRRALEREELRLYYQPIVSLRTGRIEGVEALLRWMHPERGTVAAGDFIPLAEETGLIHPIGRWVLEEACRRAAEWGRRARPVAVSVNLSVRQFAQPELIEQVSRALREADADARSLRLEVTESVLVESPDAAAATLGLLKALGIQVHLDDFGTGYSSLSLLHRLPLDVLKVDRSFVGRMGPEGDDADTMVRTITTLASSLGLATVAEGVETPEQLAALRALGCDAAQGFLFSHPLDAAATRALLDEDPVW